MNALKEVTKKDQYLSINQNDSKKGPVMTLKDK